MAQLRIYFLILTFCLCISSLTAGEEDDREMLCDGTSCEDYECPDTDSCLYGEVLDVCQCCYTCAKGPGEQCGGMFDLAGKCVKGYYCQPHPKYSQLPGVCMEQTDFWLLKR